MNLKKRHKILFLTTSHQYNDDRIFYHQAKELVKNGFQVKICSLSSDFVDTVDGIEVESFSILTKTVSEKIDTFRTVIEKFQPDCIIASEPLAIIASKKIKKEKAINIIYDVTEWYPSFSMLQELSMIAKISNGLKFFLIQLYAGFLSNHFIFGEETKKMPLAYIFPWKKKLILPYYPDEIYTFKNINALEKGKIKLCYTGQISEEKGIGNFFKTIDILRKKNNKLIIEILIIGSTRSKNDEAYFNELLKKYDFENIKIIKPFGFTSFTKSYAEADICFDLRRINFENNHSLPIKLFYYASSGKPVVYSNLKAIRKHLDISKFGYLVDPEKAEVIADLVQNYVNHEELYLKHANNARKEYETNFNWSLIRNLFIDFVKKSV